MTGCARDVTEDKVYAVGQQQVGAHIHVLCGVSGCLLTCINDLVGSIGSSDQDEASSSNAT